MTFDPKKPVQTRDGRKARILATDIDSMSPIVAAIKNQKGHSSEIIAVYNAQGRVHDNELHAADLVNIPERVSRWINIYPPYQYTCKSRKEADAAAYDFRTGVIELIFEDNKVIDVIKHDLESK